MLAILLAAAVSAAAAPQLRWEGMLCVSDGATVEIEQRGCVKTTSSRVAVTGGKLLLWRSATGDRFVATRRGPEGTAVDLAAVDGTIAFALAPPAVARRGVGDPTTVTITTADHSAQWRFRIPPSSRPRSVSIAVTPGTYALNLEAPHFRPLQRTGLLVAPSSEKIADLGQLRLEPSLQVRGRVVEAGTPRPIVGAVVSSEDKRVSTTTGPDGAFQLELSTPPPWRVVASHPSFATSAVDIERSEDDALFLPIGLHRGSTLIAELLMPPESERAKVTLFRPRGRTREKLDEREAEGVQPRVSFPKVEPGDYVLEVRGKGPLEQKQHPLRVEDVPETIASVSIAPTEIVGRVLHGSEPLPAAHLVLSHQTGSKGELNADGNGEFRATAWEHGTFLVQIEHPNLPAPFRTLKELEEVGTVDWQLMVPDQRIVGHVIDAVSGAGIADATVQIESVGDGMSLSRSVTADHTGNFEFGGMPGEHTFTAWAAGYAATRGIRVVLGPDDKVRDVAIRMEREETTDVVIVDAAGNPIPDAAVIADVTNGGTEYDFLGRTNALGEVKVPLRRSSRKVIYVVPPSGSFAIANITYEEQPQRIVVSPPVAGMNVVARTTDGEAVPNVALLLKYNGVFVPQVVARLLQRTVGSLRTDVGGQVTLRRLPPGMYGIWPYQTPEEVDAIMRGLADAPAPVEVPLSAGRADVRLTFRPRASR